MVHVVVLLAGTTPPPDHDGENDVSLSLRWVPRSLSPSQDVYGADFANGDGDPFDDQMHGTHCAGTIAGGRSLDEMVGGWWPLVLPRLVGLGGE